MSKVITFSRYFPAYHPRANQATYFPGKILKQIGIDCESESYRSWILETNKEVHQSEINYYFLETEREHQPKHHTIRAGKRWKAGDMFSPRVWSGKPYHSKQIIIAPDIEIVKTWDFEIEDEDIFLNRRCIFTDIMGRMDKTIDLIAANDGLSTTDLLSWFKYPKPFSGQIICWNKEVNYGE